MTTHSYKYYEINVIDFGADPSGILDSSFAFNQAIAQAVLNQSNRIYIPLSQGQKYKLSSPVIIPNPDFYIFGDSVFSFIDSSNINFGYIFPDVNFNSSSSFSLFIINDFDREGSFKCEGLNFKNTIIDSLRFLNLFTFSRSNITNISKYILFEKISAFHFNDLFHFTNNGNTANWEATSQFLMLKDCNFNLNNKLIKAENSVINIHVQNIQSVFGASITDKICGNINIIENNFKEAINLIKTEPKNISAGFKILFDRNDLQNTNGDYVILAKGASDDNELLIGNQISIESCTCLDIYKIEGRVKTILNDEFQRTNYFSNNNQWRRKSPILLNPDNDIYFDIHLGYSVPSIAILTPGSSLKSNGYYDVPCPHPLINYQYYSLVFLPYFEYDRQLPFIGNSNMTKLLGSNDFSTPFDYTNYGLVVQNSLVGYCEIDGLSYRAQYPEDNIVVNFLIQFKDINGLETLSPEIIVKDGSGNFIQRIKNFTIRSANADQWFILMFHISNNLPHQLNQKLKFEIRLNSSQPLTTNAQMQLAGIGAYIVPIEDRIHFPSYYRQYIRPFVPYPF